MSDPKLLDLPVPTIDESLVDTRLAITSEYEEVGESAFDNTSTLYPLGTALGRLFFDVFVRAREFASQGTPFGATGANLDSQLEAEGIAVPVAAVAVLTVAVTGREAFSLPAGTTIASDGGQLYTTNAQLDFDPGPAGNTLNVQITAAAIGSLYNLEVGSTVNLAIIDDDIDPRPVVVSVDTPGADPADDCAKNDLLRAKKAQSNAAGTAANYRFLLAQLDGAIGDVYSLEAYPYNGSISLFPLLRLTTQEQSTTPWLIKIPTAGQLSGWQTQLEADDVRSVNDRVFVDAVTERLVPLEIIPVPDTPEIRTAIDTALKTGFGERYAIEGYTIPNSEISGMIANTQGVTDHTLVDVDGLGPAGDAVAAITNLLQVGIITWPT
jgi:hypothetical protein